MDFNYLIAYIPLLLQQDLDNQTLLKLFLMFIGYIITQNNLQQYATDMLNKYKSNKYKHLIRYTQHTVKTGSTYTNVHEDYVPVVRFLMDSLVTLSNVSYVTRQHGNYDIIEHAKDLTFGDICVNIYSTTCIENEIIIFSNIVELSTVKEPKAVSDFIVKIRTDFKKQEEERENKRRIKYIFNVYKVDTEHRTMDRDVDKFETTKSFDNLFFSQKDTLLYSLDYFLNNEVEYKRLGRPYNLGILLSGCPGSGKTSTIKAIANYTNRNIVKIDLSKIKTIRQLKYILNSETGLDRSKSVIVFEEIDCGSWEHIVRSRKLPPLVEPKKIICLEKNDVILDLLDKDTEITLADFLDFLDGIVEYSGRIIIMTSNHPETLDEALLRPGRIDLNLQLNEMDKVDVNRLYKLWFGEDLPGKIFENMHDYKFTQADLGLLFSSKNKDKIYKKLQL
jgi:hypothetical protein